MGVVDFVRRVRRTIREDSEYRVGRRGTFWGRFAVARWRWTVTLCLFNDDGRYTLHLFCLWVKLWRTRREVPSGEMMLSWGGSFQPDEASVHLNWGSRYKILHAPWAMEFVRKEVMMADGSFATAEEAGRFPKWLTGYYRKYRRANGGLKPAPARRGYFTRETPAETIREHLDAHTPQFAPDSEYRREVPYRYTLKNGTVQDVTATVTVDRMTWCWRGFYRLGIWFPKKVRTSIDVRFSDEVGEGSGSWKGGTVGCGYEMKPGEIPLQTLRRMEAEKKF